MATKPEDKIVEEPVVQEEQQLSSIPDFCPYDGTMLVNGEKYGFPALVCPDCDYFKFKL